PSLHAGSAHTDDLEVYLQGLQSEYFELPGEPAQDSPATAPREVAAIRVGDTAHEYRVALFLHNLRTSGDNIIIERVGPLLLDVVRAPFPPVNVWDASTLHYGHNPYLAVYRGEPSAARLAADYYDPSDPADQEQLQLQHLDTDTISIQLASTTSVRLRFQIQ